MVTGILNHSFQVFVNSKVFRLKKINYYFKSFYGAVPEFRWVRVVNKFIISKLLFYNIFSNVIRCKLPNLANDTYEIWGPYQQELIDKYIPLNHDPNINEFFDKCHVKSFFNESFSNNTSNYTLNTCSEYVYSKKYYESTLVTEVLKTCGL
jgi:hypothetical protein